MVALFVVGIIILIIVCYS